MSLLSSEVLTTTSATPAIVAASGWYNTETIVLGVLRFRAYPTARDTVDRLFESIGLDAAVVEVAALLPEVTGLAKPGRFLLAKAELECAMGGDAPQMHLVALFNDVLLLRPRSGGAVRLLLLENCVALETPNQTLDVYESSANARVVLRLDTPEALQHWLRRLMFACTVTKSKFRGSTQDRKRMQTIRGGRTQLDQSFERMSLE